MPRRISPPYSSGLGLPNRLELPKLPFQGSESGQFLAVGTSSLPVRGSVGQIIHNNLPSAATPFIGRTEEVQRVANLLRTDDVRLVTLTGPGGTGKTRLAIAAAAQMLPQFKHGVRFISLEDVRDPGLVLSELRFSLGCGKAVASHCRKPCVCTWRASNCCWCWIISSRWPQLPRGSHAAVACQPVKGAGDQPDGSELAR